MRETLAQSDDYKFIVIQPMKKIKDDIRGHEKCL